MKYLLNFQGMHFALLSYMKQLPKLLSLQIILIVLFSIAIHWNSNSNSLCPTAFKLKEELTMALAIKAEKLLEEHRIYNNELFNVLINDIWQLTYKWERNQDSLSQAEFIALREKVKQLEELLTAPQERTRSNYSNSSRVSQQKSEDLLNLIIKPDEPNEPDKPKLIEPNKVYTVKPTISDHDFYVLFTSGMEKMINQRRTEIRISRSLNALLKGPVLGANNSTGIKKLTGQKSFFEIKIMGSKGVGNFRIGLILYKGIYYIVNYTNHHIERRDQFIESLRAQQQIIESNNSVSIP